MTKELRPSDPAYWQNRWKEGRTGWDQGGIHPLFPDLFAAAKEAGLRDGAKIVEPGCGRAHTAAMLARSGFDVTAFDVSEDAIAAAQSLYADIPRLRLLVANLFDPLPEWNDSFDAVYDRAVLCALPQEVRSKYVATCVRILKPGGLFMSLPFARLHIGDSEGPPFAIPENQFSELLTPGFVKISHRLVEHREADSKIAAEMIAVWRKKGA